MNKVRGTFWALAALLSYSQLLQGFTTPASAASASSTFEVSAEVQAAGCTISASPLGFGTITPGQSINSQADITVNCSTGVTYSVSLDGGLNGQGLGSSCFRNMSSASNLPNLLLYKLFQDSSLNTDWGGAGSAGNCIPLSATGTGADQTHTVYGRASASPEQAAGSYTDTITATVNF